MIWSVLLSVTVHCVVRTDKTFNKDIDRDRECGIWLRNPQFKERKGKRLHVKG